MQSETLGTRGDLRDDAWALDVVRVPTFTGPRRVQVLRPRRIRPGERLPLAVFHDGQRAFAPGEASWRAPHTITRLVDAGAIPPLIAVAVDNAGERRAAEYSHVVRFPRQDDARPEGTAYERMLIDEILPVLRERYPLTSDPGRSAVIGSSLGGLVSYHLAFRRPDVFGLVGILSPYLAHIDPERGDEHRVWSAFAAPGPTRVWLDVGDTEATLSVAQVAALRDHLLHIGYRDGDTLAWRLHRGGVHHEDDWAARLPSVLLHLFADATPVVSTRFDLDGRFPLGQRVIEAGPLVTYADGRVRTSLEPLLVTSDGAARADTHTSAIVLQRAGTARLRTADAASSAAHEIEIFDSPALARLEITVTGSGLDTEDGLTYSWLPLHRVDVRTFRGVFRLPVGLGFDGALTRHSDSALAGGGDERPVRRPLRLEGDHALDIVVDRWVANPHPL